MGLFDRIFGSERRDPTADWPAATGASPQVNVERGALGTAFAQLAFGDEVERGAFLGRADAFTGDAQHFTLAYHQWGLELSFEGRRLAEVAFQIGRDPLTPHAGLVPGTPTGPDGLSLTATTTEADLRSRFGEPGSRQDFDEETVLYYHLGAVVSEFQLNGEKRLLSWTVYLD